MKDYLGFENARNKRNAPVYERLMRAAFAPQGEQCAVLIGHHLTFELNGDLGTENEIPSADCLMFDHEVMGRVFGTAALGHMMHLAALPVERRDAYLTQIVNAKLGVEVGV